MRGGGNMEQKMRRLDIVQWGIVILFTVIGIALCVTWFPLAILLFIVLGWGIAEGFLPLVFDLSPRLMSWLLMEV